MISGAIDMKASVVECSGASGSITALPSLWETLVGIVAVAARGDGEVDGVKRESKCITTLLRALQGLGYRAEWISSTKLTIHEEGEQKSRVVVDTTCGLLVPGLIAPLAAVRLPPGGQLIVRGTSESSLSFSLRPLIEAVIAVGGRAWPGGTLSRLVVVEPSIYKPHGRIARLYGPPGFIAAGVAAALAATGGGRLMTYGSPVRGVGRLAAMTRALRLAGFEVTERGPSLIIGVLEDGKSRLVVEGGLHETALLLALASPCIGGEIRIEGLPIREEELSTLEYMLKATGFEAYKECRDPNCSIVATSFKPLSATITVRDEPGYMLYAAAQAAAWARLVISGLNTVTLEGLLDKRFESFLQQLGVNAFYEDEGDRLVAEGEQPKSIRRNVECNDPVYCAAALARLLRLGSGSLKGIDVLEDIAPGVLEGLLALGVYLDVS